MMRDDLDIRVMGAGGGGGGKKGNKDDKNTLRSKARARMIELVSEGEIVGLVDENGNKLTGANRAKAIFFDQTPVMNADGSLNFENVVIQERVGLPDQEHFTGSNAVETPVSVEVQVKKTTGPVLRTIVDQNADAVRVIVRIPALAQTDEKSGALKATSVHYQFQVRANAGEWETVVDNDIRNEKTISPYQIAHRIPLPADGSPWDLRMVRITDDSEDVKLQNETWWEGYFVLVEGKFTYPHSAAVSIEVNAEDMGQSIPPRAGRFRGIKCLVPVNYDPVTRTFDGIWNGTFKKAWTNDPPWIFYDIVTNNRYGLGEFVPAAAVDKWSLYAISQYCNQMIPSGYKNGDTGEDILEPRFTYNGVLNTKEEAYFVLQQIATAWRGMSYWALGRVFSTADMPADPVKIVTPANVIGGQFNYSGTALKARHSVALVKWNDPADFYRPAVEVVVNDEMLQKYGWREKQVQTRGITSRGLAHRHGKWILDVEQHETETVSYQASWDHVDVRPGDIIAVADPAKASVRAGGRIVSHVGNVVTLDAAFAPEPGNSYQLMLTMPDGTVVTKPISGFAGAAVTVSSAYPQTAQADAMFLVTGTDVEPRQYRVLAVDETEANIFKITALFHDPNKYARVEYGVKFDPPSYRRPKNEIFPPTNLQLREANYQFNSVAKTRLEISWSPNNIVPTRHYRVEIDTPSTGTIVHSAHNKTWIDVDDIQPGTYAVRIYSVAHSGLTSAPVTGSIVVAGPTGLPLPIVTNLRLHDRAGSTVFVGRDVHVAWTNNFASSSDPSSEDYIPKAGPSPHYLNNTLKFYDGVSNTLLRTQTFRGETFNYSYDLNVADSAAAGLSGPCRSVKVEVIVNDIHGRSSAAIDETFTNPSPITAAPTSFLTASTLLFQFDPPSEADYAGMLVWQSTSPGIDTGALAPLYDISGNTLTIPVLPSTTYYFRFAAYDSFGKTGLDVTGEMSVTTMADGGDFEAPATPTGLALSSAIAGDVCTLTAVCDANSEPDLAGYIFEIKEGAGDYVGFPTNGPRYEWTAKSGVTYSVRVLAFDQAQNKSNFTVPETHVAAQDSTPPATPTGLVAVPGIDAIWLKWNANAESDFRHYEIFENSVDNFATATMIGRSAATVLARTGLDLETTRYYWLKAVDTSGNKSAETASVTATTGNVPGADVEVNLLGITFSTDATLNRISWSAGTAAYGVVGETPTETAIAAGFANWTVGTVYIYYVPGNAALSSHTNLATVYASGGIIAASYRGGHDQQVANGKPLIHGSTLVANSIGAGQLVTGSAVITGAAQIAEAIIGDAHITSLDAALIRAGTVLSGEVIVGGRAIGTVVDDAYHCDFGNAQSFGWSKTEFGGTVTFAGGSGYPTGNGGMILTNTARAEPDERVPFDSTRLYRVTTRVWTSTATGGLYCYLNCYDSAGTFLGRVTYAVNIDQQGAFLASAGWVDIVGYIKGIVATPVNATGPTKTGSVLSFATASISNPLELYSGTKTVKPGVIANHPAGTGGVHVDMVRVEVVNEDAADIVNAGTTLIQPGKVLISGSTTLSSWTHGGDATLIDGGKIAANTIHVNMGVFGLRGVDVQGIQFEHNSPGANQVSWTAGTISYIGDDGNIATFNIAAGNSAVVPVGDLRYITYTKGASVLGTTPTASNAYDASQRVILAIYKGGTDLVVNVGRTVIDGSIIKTGTVTATQIDAASIRSAVLIADAVQATHLAARSVTARNLVIADTSNIVTNPTFNGGSSDGWSLSGCSVIEHGVAGQAFPTRYALSFNPATAGLADPHGFLTADDGMIPAQPGDVYYMSAWFWKNLAETRGGYFQALGYNRDRGYVTATTVWVYAAATDVNGWKEAQVAVPNDPSIAFVRFRFGMQAGTSSTIRVGQPFIRRANHGKLIVDGSIQANHIDAASVKTVILTAGSITTDMLTIGQHGNLLENSDLTAGTTNWGMGTTNATSALSIRADAFAPPGGAIQLYQPNATATGYADLYQRDADGAIRYFDVVAGESYQLSAYLLAHRCNGQLYIEWRNASDAVISYSSKAVTLNQGTNPNYQLSGYLREWVKGVAPATAVKARIMIRKYATLTGTNSFLWVARPFFGSALPNQTEPSPWTNTGVTKIGPGHLSVPSLSAISADIGTATAGILQSPDGKTVFNLNLGKLSFSD